MDLHHCINYIEMPVRDIGIAKAFYSHVFGWEFIDYGPEYTSFTNVGIAGGFFMSEQGFDLARGTALIVIYSDDIVASQQAVEQAGGKITQAVFSFPGGKRFHFKDPNGNELAVWAH